MATTSAHFRTFLEILLKGNMNYLSNVEVLLIRSVMHHGIYYLILSTSRDFVARSPLGRFAT